MGANDKGQLIRHCIYAVGAAVVVAAATAYVMGSWASGSWVPWEHGSRIPWGEISRIAIPITALLAAVVGAVIASHNQAARLRELRNVEDANATDRFSRAIEQLASEDWIVRLGAIFSLERIGHDSQRDRPVVVQILRSELYGGAQKLRETGPQGSEYQSRAQARSVESALFAGLMRLRQHGEMDVTASLLRNHIELSGEDFSEAHLDDFSFWMTVAMGCRFDKASLKNIHVSSGTFGVTSFDDANLRGAHFDQGTLYECSFRGADLTGADFRGAVFEDCDFKGAKVAGATLDRAQAESMKQQFDSHQWESLNLIDQDVTST